MSFEFVRESDIIRDYVFGADTNKICINYDISKRKLKEILNYHNIKNNIYFQKSKYKIDEKFFEKIDSGPKAYFLGFLYADGYNSKYHNRTLIEVVERDKDIISYFKKILKTNIPIRIHKNKTSSGNNSYILDISSEKISNDLHNLGCIYKKSFSLQFPSEGQVPKKLLCHFVRGYFDGDGYISKVENANRITIVGTFDFLASLNNVLDYHLDFCGKISLAHSKYKSEDLKMYRLDVCKQADIVKFGKWIYNKAYDSFLYRKYINFKDIKINYIKRIKHVSKNGLL